MRFAEGNTPFSTNGIHTHSGDERLLYDFLKRQAFRFDTEDETIVQALFTSFPLAKVGEAEPPSSTSIDLSPSKQSPDANKALVVIFKTLMHIIYSNGGTYIVHLPFPISKMWPVPLGLVLERQLEQTLGSEISPNELPRLLTLSSPLEDFGMVACNGSSLDPNEKIVFMSSRSDSLCVTRNHFEKRLTLWHTSPDEHARRKVFHFVISQAES